MSLFELFHLSIVEYFKHAYSDTPAERLIEKALRYAGFREGGRELQAGKFSPAAYIKIIFKQEEQ